ncbi:hypothetical protein ABEB36_013798 [Hypothenemus hampei]|uniref:Uncharacterized protein n=1 Tax=Hypothenemus hampei TaxID=57062 RepID=A0ABD1E5L5_HYPHA
MANSKDTTVDIVESVTNEYFTKYTTYYKIPVDDIKKIAPGYRGKTENFDPVNSGKKNPKTPRKPSGNALTVEPPPPTNPQTRSTTSYAKVVDVAAEVYDEYCGNEKQLERLLVREEMSYYATAMLYLQLVEVKAKQGEYVLTTAERSLRKAVSEDIFNAPQPLLAYLSEIGVYCDKMGKETRLSVPDLPVTVAQGFGGYHHPEINVDTRNLFEEVPSLGIVRDMIMAVTSAATELIPNFHVGSPLNSEITNNLVGKFYPIRPPRPEIAQRIAGYGITATSFDEYIPKTRFNLRYLRSLSDIIG